MHEDPILMFLVQVLAVLALARGLGEVFRRFRQPPLAGEILAGILLGQTVLGHLAPDVFHWLFPPDELQNAMFRVTSEIGILFLLLVVGLEVNVASAWKMRHRTLTVAFTGVVVPLAVGTGVAWIMYERWVEVAVPPFAFALLVGAGIAITAITVVARLLFDLKIIKTDLGLFLISAMALNELLGWVVLAVVLGLVGAGTGAGGVRGGQLAATMGGILLFAGFALTVGRDLTTRALRWIERKELPSPAAPLSFVVCVGLLGGIVTGFLGIHPVFGFLLAGMMASDPRALSEHTRSIIEQMVEAIFVPLFFAGICLHIDFIGSFDPAMVLIVSVLSIGGKFGGAWLGARLARMQTVDRIPVAMAHIPGGPMGVLLASVANDAGVIGPRMFVALVVASILSALVVGPAFAWQLRRRELHDVLRYFSREHMVFGLSCATRADAILTLANEAARRDGMPSGETIRHAVEEREATVGTGIGHGIAIPHARLSTISEPLVILGICAEGIDWDEVDGKPAHLVFLVLTPVEGTGIQLEILARIARAFHDPRRAHELRESPDPEAAWSCLERTLAAGDATLG